MQRVDHEAAMLAIRKVAHTYNRDPHAPFEVHEWDEVDLPCSYHIRMLPTPVLKHPGGHHAVRCRVCGAIYDSTLSGDYEEG